MDRTVRLVATAPAKVNLCLDVSPETVGGRHLVRTIMLSLSLADRLEATFDPDAAEPGVSVEMHSVHGMRAEEIPLEDNLIYKAVVAFHELVGQPIAASIRIAVDKRIPAQSGLAGGSSNCAAAIALTARALGFDPFGEESVAVARLLGSDIAFFLTGGCAALEGYGDVLVEEFAAPYLDIVVARPEQGCDTGKVYRTFDRRNEQGDPAPRVPYNEMAALLRGKARVSEVATSIGNSLQEASFEVEPQVRRVFEELDGQDRTLATLVSGSGSCCFSLCRDPAAARLTARALRSAGFWTEACESARHGIVLHEE